MSPVSRNNLFPGEQLSTINGAPCITYFRPGDPSRPLAVLVPGAAHLARVFYGGHDGHDPHDFVAHWLTQQGYNFLAISYPLETDPATMLPTQPGMTVSEWGAQAVEATRQTIHRHHLLSNAVILLFWSMGGKILQPYVLAARDTNISISFAVPLVATPAIRGVRDRPILTPSPTGYATAAGLSETYFMLQLHEQNAMHNGKTIIPDETYRREYLGNFPVGLGCYGVRWCAVEEVQPQEQDQRQRRNRGSFVDDPDTGYEVADAIPHAQLPLICSISCSSPADLRHAIADKYTWGFLLTYKLLGGIAPSKRAALQTDQDKGRRVVQFIHSAPDTLSATVEGGHHFFIGEKGAKRTAELVAEFETRVADFQRDLASLLS
ncbi:hypothetical protein PV08_02896 [Exophiala spinifera]|uniref:AB hydrolase-1 domain-containing protein n=1 Tax=Exophiala spinifera TaxID=91928 RepID=A0A0D2A0W2_9EURO|nr:uncharacterized protein PV08_02896 [Exophiala spinifera]KIW18607.1 hypothetical protein PV08_02896 [Exophiala spinifera]